MEKLVIKLNSVRVQFLNAPEAYSGGGGYGGSAPLNQLNLWISGGCLGKKSLSPLMDKFLNTPLKRTRTCNSVIHVINSKFCK